MKFTIQVIKTKYWNLTYTQISNVMFNKYKVNFNKASQILYSLAKVFLINSKRRFIYVKMNDPDTYQSLIERARDIVPSFSVERHKGEAGRIGIVGGSLEYTGAPYFSAIAALKVGADLVHVFCAQSAAPVIKAYSPELIVHPLLDSNDALIQIQPWLERLHVLVIGPGLGRDHNVLKTVADLIHFCRQQNKPLVIDADGLFLIQQDISLIKDYDGVIITPNAIEFSRLFGNDRDRIQEQIQKLGSGVTILEKGIKDRIYDSTTFAKYDMPPGGSGRRCGGQGDLLSGAIATYYFWAREKQDPFPAKVACFAASELIKNCNKSAYQINGRSMVCSDMIQHIHPVFERLFESQNV